MHRKFFLTKFVCAKCGNNLRLTDDLPKNTEYERDEPASVDVVQSRVAIEPCKCVTRPLEQMALAVKTLLDTQK